MDAVGAEVPARKEQKPSAAAPEAEAADAVAAAAVAPPALKASTPEAKKGAQTKRAPARTEGLAVPPIEPDGALEASKAASSSQGQESVVAGMPLADVLRKQLLEAPNVADEIEALRKERADKRKEVAAASRKLRQDQTQLRAVCKYICVHVCACVDHYVCA
jgi:hypothetical protein